MGPKSAPGHPHVPRRDPEAREPRGPAAATGPVPAPASRLPRWIVAALVVVGLIVVVGVLAGSGLIEQIRERVAPGPEKQAEGAKDKEKKDEYPKLLRDAAGRAVQPPTIVVDPVQADALGISAKTVVAAVPAKEPRPLPSMEGQLNYDLAHLYNIRPRFAGEVESFGEVLIPHLPGKGEAQGSRWREIGVGDPVQGPHKVKGADVPGTLLAVIWSKDLGDKKAALIDALIDLHRDKQRLEKLEKGWREGVIPESTYYEAQRTVQKDLNAANAAERTLRIWRLTDKEIDDLRSEAAKIEQTKRDPRREQDWARVEVRAWHEGVIVEKNTNKGDWVDPSASPNPMFKVADLRELGVWINAREEYRLVLQQMLFNNHDAGIRMEIRLLGEPDAPPLQGEIVRIAPSLDPSMRTMLVIGRVSNPSGRLLVGQSVTATVYLKPGPDLVQIPTSALNEQDGQSLVFVQPDPKELAFALRRVAVTHRFYDVVFVRSKLTPEDEALSRKDAKQGRPPITPLRPGERVVTHGVTMLTSEVRDLTGEEKAAGTGP